jgi:release factor glutamine methyltransferase
VLDRPPTWLYAWPDTELGPAQQAAFDALLVRRAAGTPVAHLTGRREFWGLDLKVSPDTLIPRPDTELLVESALELGAGRPGLRVLDLGTGSGAVALAIAHEHPGWQVTAIDASAAALAIARDNAAALGLDHVQLLAGHWFDAIAAGAQFDLIVSNPPYVCETDPHLSRGDVAHEPRSALTAGRDGLDDLRQIIAQTPARLAPGGWLALEHGWDQGGAVRQLLQAAGFDRITTCQDLAGHDRVTLGRHG